MFGNNNSCCWIILIIILLMCCCGGSGLGNGCATPFNNGFYNNGCSGTYRNDGCCD